MKDYGKSEITQAETDASIISPITQALTKNKITLNKTCKRLNESMDAKIVKTFKTKDNKIIHSKPLIAHDIRLKATVEALKLQQAYPVDKLQIEGDTGLTIKLVQYGVPSSNGVDKIEDKDSTD